MSKAPSPQVEELFRRADVCSQQGRLREAYGLLRSAVELAPRYAPVLAAFGWVSGQLGDHAGGLPHLKKAVQIDGTKAQYHFWLGVLQQSEQDIEGAKLSLNRAIALKKDLPGPYVSMASILERTGEWAKSLEWIEKGRKATPGDAHLEAVYWKIKAEMGEREAARDGLRELLARNPAPPTDTLIRCNHTLGLTLDKLGDYDGAFEAFSRFNALRLSGDAAKNALARDDITPVVEAQKAITAETFATWRDEEPGDGLPAPGMLIGFPRSGTTMTENVLASHPGVAATPERTMLPDVVVEMQRLAKSGGVDLSAFLHTMDEAMLRRLRRMYWDAAARETDGALGPDFKAKLLVDKFPLHLVRVGIINRLFPRARVIVALRDPRDCCLSAFSQYFGINPAMVRFLTIEGAARLYEQAMGLYLLLRPRLTMPVLQVRYEDTVVDLEAQARRMLEFLGLEWNDSVLRPEDRAKKHYTGTPSFRAVTTAVNTKAKGRWVKYRAHLAPIFPILAPFVEEFGYEAA